MPISSSLILHDKIDVGQTIRHNLSMSSYGCSEFPAHDGTIVRYVSFGLAVLRDSTITGYLERGSEVAHMQEWAQFIVDMFAPIGELVKEPIFSVYTLHDYKKEASRVSGHKLNVGEKGITGVQGNPGFTFPAMELPDETIIGLQTNCNAIRKYTGANHLTEKLAMSNGRQRCRKVQFGHTMYRLMWSQGYIIPIIAMRLKKASDEQEAGLTHLQCFWLAYKAKYAISKSGNDYGDIFRYDGGYMSFNALVKRFKDVKMDDSVMDNFSEEQNPMAKDLGIVATTTTDTVIAKRVFFEPSQSYSIANALASIKAKALENAIAVIKECEDGLNSSYTQVKFKFSKSLFRSAATGVCYEGILKPNSKLNRILFRDEENCTLSVLSESKFIEMSK